MITVTDEPTGFVAELPRGHNLRVTITPGEKSPPKDTDLYDYAGAIHTTRRKDEFVDDFVAECMLHSHDGSADVTLSASLARATRTG